MPSSFRQAWVLGAAATRELLWGLEAVSRETGSWRARARSIPDTTLREGALGALASKRGNIDGAALFWILPRRRSPALLRLLVAYEVMADFLDTASEDGANAGIANGCQLHRALIEALDPGGSISDYYLRHTSKHDGAYLQALVGCCRAHCPTLPSFASVRPLVVSVASLTQVLGINHEPDPQLRDRALEQWAAAELPSETGSHWFELAAGASAWLTIFALLALGAEPEYDARGGAAVHATYLHWIAAASTMLDSYADIAEDAENGDHSYIAHYQSMEAATRRISHLITRATHTARELPDGAKHAVITASMIALYLSKDSARARSTRTTTHTFLDAGGPLARLLLPVLRAWRIAYGQRTA
jgi:tetraprenyl-beta-curcumene synthase